MQHARLDESAPENLNESLATFDPICPSTSDFLSASTPHISSGSSSTGTEGTHNLVTPSYESVDPIVVDAQTLPTDAFTFDHADVSLWASDNACASPAFDFGSEINTSSPSAAAWQLENLIQRDPSPNSRAHKRKRDSDSSLDASELMVKNLSQNALCEDLYNLLESELPRWTREGLWYEASQDLADPLSTPTTDATLATPLTYSKLERAYLAVCQLNSRMGDDVIRNRMALIQLHLEYTEIQQGRRHTSVRNRVESTVGRGHASHAIDRILENIHEGWSTLSQRRRAELRAKFHDRKKYGKRWSQLADAFGPAILLICSAKLASAV
ncbi:uncharacterized protein KY384_004522 [Bacidia gigantensis]|uniref:uncharacterized protein n=1 Tax=Bacidia gigantensis TaxID=2732470 RepID=UPI001D03D5AC|nr:uncharacterized protein KY384_004522 [Bacidia gigantensis]KAG8531164.1 hypothetical protein KY384_004522 [Bacidia gigantensis]